MLTLTENIKCYKSEAQRKLLLKFSELSFVTNNFFLTRGTSLAVFYLHHRVSDDLDFFTTNELDLSRLDFLIKESYGEFRKINQSNYFLSYIINDVKFEHYFI